MAGSPAVIPSSAPGPFRNPWPALASGLGAALAASLWLLLTGWAALPLVIVALLATGTAVAIRPRAPVILFLAALAGFLTENGMAPAWDSARLMLGVFASIAVIAGVLLLLPR